MRFWVLHVDDRRGGEDEDVVLADPVTKVAAFVPLAAIGEFIPIASQASENVRAARCEHCDAQLPAAMDEPPAAAHEGA